MIHIKTPFFSRSCSLLPYLFPFHFLPYSHSSSHSPTHPPFSHSLSLFPPSLNSPPAPFCTRVLTKGAFARPPLYAREPSCESYQSFFFSSPGQYRPRSKGAKTGSDLFQEPPRWSRARILHRHYCCSSRVGRAAIHDERVAFPSSCFTQLPHVTTTFHPHNLAFRLQTSARAHGHTYKQIEVCVCVFV